MRSLLSGAITLTLAAATLSGVTATHADTADAPSPADHRVRGAIETLMTSAHGPPGTFVLVQNAHRTKVFRSGVADIENDRPMTGDLHMRIASTAKAYSGAVALTLAQRGALSLRDTIGQRLPWAPRAWRSVTLGQALHHTSGLPDYSASDGFSSYLEDHLDQAPPPRRLLGFVADEPLEFAPGSRFHYSNSDNVVAALMIADAMGRPYEKVLAHRVLRPLGLHGTSLPSGTELARPRMLGYAPNDDGQLSDVTSVFAAGYAWASGGIVSTPRDQNRFIRGYIGRTLFDRRTQNRQFSFVRGHSEPPGPGRNTAGLAVFRYKTRCGTMYGHTGNTAGYTQFMAASKDGRSSVVVAINRQLIPDAYPRAFDRLRKVYRSAVCEAFSGR